MIRSLYLFLFLSTFLHNNWAQTKDPKDTEVWEPEPRVVTPGEDNAPPSDAIILFDGENLDEWMAQDSSAAKWKLEEDGAVTVVKGSGPIISKRKFGDIQLHIEWRSPAVIESEGQGRGNSGIFLQGRYEVQVLDSYNNRTYSNGQAGSIYKQYIPLVNACKPPGEWQSYDILFTAPRFNDDGIRIAPGQLTVLHNGVLIQHHVDIQGTTEYIGLPKNVAHGDGAIILQDHSNPVSYRNIWVREL
ncbi:MAG: DUF1080 domain-containing protein [Bacteroidota bacterium]